MTGTYFDAALHDQPLMGVFRNLSPQAAVARATRAWDAGVRNVEIPVQTADALATLRAVVAAGRERGRDVGAGTIVDVEQFDEVIAAGAAYSVSPGMDAEIVHAAIERGVAHLPGVGTATEILAARRLGLRWVKAFPASVLGAAWISAMRGPFPEMRFVTTGGMKIATAADYLAAGASTVALGDAFDDEASLERVRELLRAGG